VFVPGKLFQPILTKISTKINKLRTKQFMTLAPAQKKQSSLFLPVSDEEKNVLSDFHLFLSFQVSLSLSGIVF
jgi:hypothetical protein